MQERIEQYLQENRSRLMKKTDKAICTDVAKHFNAVANGRYVEIDGTEYLITKNMGWQGGFIVRTMTWEH